jgi:hypothetical protein
MVERRGGEEERSSRAKKVEASVRAGQEDRGERESRA